ncbi:MAG TPA: TetR/AcrR family transcriptional regulator [Egibacteraceae bacterium]|nr:TetR/AcrR family transcriptional regulator [Egibacteraceae bacterium]
MSREETIVAAATQLFAEYSYAAVGIRAIAESVGIMSSSLYYYFPSKEDILFRICQQATRDFIAVHGAVLASHETGGSRAETLKTLMGSHVRYFWENRLAQQVAARELSQLSPERFEEVRDWQRAYTADLVEYVEMGVAAGEFDVPEPAIVVRAALDMLNSVFRWFTPRKNLGIDEVAELYADLIVDRLLGAAHVSRGENR